MNITLTILKSIASLILAWLLLAFAIDREQVWAATPDVTEVCDLTFTGNIQLHSVPIARTAQQQTNGLSNREDVGSGMLFAYNSPRKLAFWMRNTRIPLSIAFMSEDGTMFIVEDMVPESDEYHLSMKPAKYALELAMGQFERKGLTVGSRLLKKECRFMK